MKKILSLVALSSILIPAFGQTNQIVRFAWDASPDIVAGYHLYLNTNRVVTTNGLSASVDINIFPIAIDSKITVTAFDTNSIESDFSNAVFLNRPIAPYSLEYSNLTSSGVIIKWAPHPSVNVNSYYVFVGTNKSKTVVNDNSIYLDATNLVRTAQNPISIIAFNNNRTNSAGTYILESQPSTNLNIVLPPRPPTNLRISVIIQSSTNLISWNSITNYEYLADSSLPFEVFRAKLEIEKNSELIN